MTKARWAALAGPMALLAGGMWVLWAIFGFALLSGLVPIDTSWAEAWFFSFYLSFVPLLFAMVGIGLRFHQAAGLPGRLGLALSVAGCAGMLVVALSRLLLGRIAMEILRPGPWINYITDASFLGFMVGNLLFGVDALRFRLLPRWNLLPLLAGSTIVYGFVTTFLSVPAYHPLQMLSFLVIGVCWELLGISLGSVNEWKNE